MLKENNSNPISCLMLLAVAVRSVFNVSGKGMARVATPGLDE